MATFDTWELYFYPPPDDAIMRNVHDIRDPQALQTFGYGVTATRQWQVQLEPSLVARTYDGDHMRAIHGHLFQDAYEWAGEYRTVNMTKGPGRGFADISNGELDRYLRDDAERVRGPANKQSCIGPRAGHDAQEVDT